MKMRRFESQNAMISSGRIEATNIGIEILKQGGNAIDAAVAVGFAMGVCEPATSGLGGGGFMTIVTPDNEKPIFLDFREHAPQSAHAAMWTIGDDGKVVDKENAVGAKSIAVPGETAGLIYALEHYGTMSLKQIVQPSVELAMNGFVATDMFEKILSLYCKHLSKCKFANDIFCQGIKAGDFVKNKNLAHSLTRIAENGKSEFYEGDIANKIVKSVKKAGGLLTLDDLQAYEVDVKDPVVGTYRGYTIISSPPPSSGGTHIIQALNILENFDVSALEVNSAEYLHLFSEVFKLAYKDRAKFMADTKFIDVPLKGLRSKKYAAVLAKKIDFKRASVLDCYDPWTYEHDDTTHYSIGDKAGYLVSVTKTINHFFGSCIVAKDTGILLNDTMADFSINRYNVNSVEGNKKPLSSMSPTIILKDGEPVAILGSPGGVRIINVVVQVISKLIDHGMDIQQAIESPRITQDASNTLKYETRISPEVVSQLSDMGHELLACLDWDKKMGGVHGVFYKIDGMLVGGADPRRDGAVNGI